MFSLHRVQRVPWELGMTSSRRQAVRFFSAVILIGFVSHIQALPIGGLPTLPPPPAAQMAKLDPLLVPMLSQSTGRTLVIVRAYDVTSLAALAQLIQQNGGTLGRLLPIVEAYA